MPTLWSQKIFHPVQRISINQPASSHIQKRPQTTTRAGKVSMTRERFVICAPSGLISPRSRAPFVAYTNGISTRIIRRRSVREPLCRCGFPCMLAGLWCPVPSNNVGEESWTSEQSIASKAPLCLTIIRWVHLLNRELFDSRLGCSRRPFTHSIIQFE